MKKKIGVVVVSAAATAIAAITALSVEPVEAQLNCDGPVHWCQTVYGCDAPGDCRTVIYYQKTAPPPLPGGPWWP